MFLVKQSDKYLVDSVCSSAPHRHPRRSLRCAHTPLSPSRISLSSQSCLGLCGSTPYKPTEQFPLLLWLSLSLSLTHTHTHWHTSANIQPSERLIPLAIASMGGPAVAGFARLPCWSLTHRNTISLSLSVPEHLSAVCGWDWERLLHVSQKTATRELIATMTTIPITV